MKQIFNFNLRLLTAVSVIMLFTLHNSLFAQNNIRLGTYDSRAIAVAYFNSDFASSTMKIMRQLKVDDLTAIEEKDTLKSKKLQREGQLRQAMLHEQGFGTGSVRECMLAIKDKVDELAKQEKLDIIVSKWELNYSIANAEIVDVTEQLASLFQSKMPLEEMLKEMRNQDPIKEAYLIDD